MDPITLITLATIGGSAIIGKKVLEKSTEQVWDRFVTRLRAKAQGNDEASAVLAKPEEPERVYQAIQAIDAHQDQELIELAQQLTKEMQQTQPHQYMQLADKIINIQTNFGDIHFH